MIDLHCCCKMEELHMAAYILSMRTEEKNTVSEGEQLEGIESSTRTPKFNMFP